MCGDATRDINVSLALAGVKPHLMVTDQPWGVDYDANWRSKRLRKDGGPSADRATGKVENDNRFNWSEVWLLFPGKVAYVWTSGLYAGKTIAALETAQFKRRCLIVWAKQQFVIGRGHYHAQHKPCWYAIRGASHWNGDRTQSTLWQIDKPRKSETGHSTQKPVEVHEAPDRKQLKPRPGRIRSVCRKRNNNHRRRK